jgi:hypothetical protein
MKPTDSLLCLQQPIIGPYSEPLQSSQPSFIYHLAFTVSVLCLALANRIITFGFPTEILYTILCAAPISGTPSLYVVPLG